MSLRVLHSREGTGKRRRRKSTAVFQSGVCRMQIQLPEKAQYIIDTIEKAGYEAYAVGGCVRDSLLGKVPQDWDITTSATPQQVKALFNRTVDTGIRHGTVTVMLGREGFEVTTYRIDGKYEDGRHPREVMFTPSLEEDLKRRDFTVNAIAYNDRSGLIDIFGGMEDMEQKVIRCVGDAGERFQEDALRMMRAVRFSAQLGYRIEERIFAAIKSMAPNLSLVSAERIQAELVKLVVSPHPDYLRSAYAAGITKVVLPEFDVAMETPQRHPHHCYSVGEHILQSMLHIEPRKELRLAMLLHDIGKPGTLETDGEGITHFRGHEALSEAMARKILRRLRFDNDTTDLVCRLVKDHDYGNNLEPDMKVVRRAVNRIGEDIFPLLLLVKRADVLAQSEYMRKEKLEKLKRWESLYQRIREENQCVSLRDLAVTGKDLIQAGMKPGREIGDTLHNLLELVIENPDCNNKEILLKEACRLQP